MYHHPEKILCGIISLTATIPSASSLFNSNLNASSTELGFTNGDVGSSNLCKKNYNYFS